jgi:hypothetical protein
MARAEAHPEITLLLRALDQAYDQKSWHGPNLRGSLRGRSAEQAAWRPRPERHCIADHVLHAAYWKYVVRRRLRGDKRGSFARKGSNWFPLPTPWTEAEWRRYLDLLQAEHQELRAAVAGLAPELLRHTPAGSKVSPLDLIQGIAAHDLYHTGQIQLLKRLQDGTD